MLKKMMFFMIIFLLFSTNTIAQINNKIEIFDVKQEKVVSSIERTPEIQREVETFLKNITGVFKKLDPVPTSGFMVKVPLDPKFNLENNYIKAQLVEVIVVFSIDENPYLLVFDNENNFYAFTFEGKTDSFLEKLNYNPMTSN
ncbi:hypothetical protein IM538_04910 [Cytobacillus suaedae]|nr:hypothetical protein IM538_04910 [Cytobacillus suaedae]